MNRRPRLADPEHHRAFVEALVRRAGELERRAAGSADEVYRSMEPLRDDAGAVEAELVKAINTLIAATTEVLAATERMHLAIARVAEEEPQRTRWQRWRVRRMLQRAIASMERGVVDLENRR